MKEDGGRMRVGEGCEVEKGHCSPDPASCGREYIPAMRVQGT